MDLLIFTIASAFFFALTFFFRKQAGAVIPVQTAYFIETCMQMLLMTLAFFLFFPQTKEAITLKSSSGYIFSALAGVSIVIGVLLSYAALKLGLLSKFQAIASPAQIIFAGMLGMLLIGESFTLKQVIGTIVSIGGILLIVL